MVIELRREAQRPQRCCFVRWEQGSYYKRDGGRKEERKEGRFRMGGCRRRRPHWGLADQLLPQGLDLSI